MAEGQAVGHGLASGLHLSALIEIEQTIGFQKLSAALLNDLHDLARRNLLRDNHGNVTAHCRELRNALVVVRKGCLLQNTLQIDARDVYAVVHAVGSGNGRMNLAHVADHGVNRCSLRAAVRIRENNPCLPSGMQEILPGIRVAQNLFRNACGGQEILHNTL